MQTCVSILRGINVSGHKLIRMKALQEMFENLGLRNIKTYIQSGNVVFDTESTETGKLEKIISEEISKTFGFEVPVLVIPVSELKKTSENNLFINERGEDASKLHITFLSGVPEKKLAESIHHGEYFPDEFDITGKTVYLFCPNGYGNTKLSNNFFEKKLKVPATTRNWKTVVELVKLSEKA